MVLHCPSKARESPAFRALLPPRVHTQVLFNTTRSREYFLTVFPHDLLSQNDANL